MLFHNIYLLSKIDIDFGILIKTPLTLFVVYLIYQNGNRF